MNRLILKYGYPITAVILAVFAWVIYRRIASGWSGIIPLAIAAVIVWALGAPAFIYLWPRLTVSGFKRAIVKHGFGGGPIPVNTLYAVAQHLFPVGASGSLMATGTDDVLYVGGWLDLSKGPQVLHVPDMAGRYLQRAVHRPVEQRQFRLRRQTYDGNQGRRLSSQRARLEGNRTERHDADFFAKQFRARHRPCIRRERQRSPTAYALAQQIQLAPLNQ